VNFCCKREFLLIKFGCVLSLKTVKMTIITSKLLRKDTPLNCPDPEVVTESCPEKMLIKDEKDLDHPAMMMTTVSHVKRRSNCTSLCILLMALLVLTIGVLGGLYLYKRLAQKTLRGFCKVRYYEFEDDISRTAQLQHKVYRPRKYGEFKEFFEIDNFYGQYERIDVPQFDDIRRAVVLHDFEKNWTAVADRDHFRCFIMELNRTTIKPPHDFWDMMEKLSNGYYLPDVELVRESYQAILPPIDLTLHMNKFGHHIGRECQVFNTFMLRKTMGNKPVAMNKRAIGLRKRRSSKSAVNYAIASSTQQMYVISLPN